MTRLSSPSWRSRLVFALLLGGCTPPLDRGTHQPQRFLGDQQRIGRTDAALAARIGEVTIVGGDGLVSGIGDRFGIRFDEARNDLFEVVARFGAEGADVDGLLVLFTTFDDRGSAGPAYHVPLYQAVAGTGEDDVDQRAEARVQRLTGVANLKRLDAHDDATAIFMHEIGHRHLAHLVAEVEGSTSTAPLLGRQSAHWHAMLETNGSVLGGHAFVESQPGRFVVTDRDARYSALDLYGLGLVAKDEVGDFFFIADAKNERGFSYPAEAQLEVGSVVIGRRVNLSIDDVVRAVGPRVPAYGDAARVLRLRFGLLTAPGESVTSTTVVAMARDIEAFRSAMDGAYSTFTNGRGSLCSTIAECATAPPPIPVTGCDCSIRGPGETWTVSWWAWGALGLLAFGQRWTRRGRTRISKRRTPTLS